MGWPGSVCNDPRTGCFKRQALGAAPRVFPFYRIIFFGVFVGFLCCCCYFACFLGGGVLYHRMLASPYSLHFLRRARLSEYYGRESIMLRICNIIRNKPWCSIRLLKGRRVHFGLWWMSSTIYPQKAPLSPYFTKTLSRLLMLCPSSSSLWMSALRFLMHDRRGSLSC